MATPHASDAHILDRTIAVFNRLQGLKVPGGALQGTHTATLGSTAVTGSSSHYDADLVVGDSVVFSGDAGNYYRVAAIGSATAMTIDPAFRGATAASQTAFALVGALGDQTIADLANPGTCALLEAAVTLADTHASNGFIKTGGVGAIKIAAAPFFGIAAPTLGTITLADSGGSLPDSTTYYYAVVAVDVNGRSSYPSAEGSKATGTAGAGNVHVITIPWTEPAGGFTYRVYRGIAAGTYTFYKDVVDAATTTHASDVGWTATTTSLATLQTGAAPYNSAGFGMLTDDMVDDGRDATFGTNFATTRNALADQSDQGTARRTWDSPPSVPYVP